MMIGSSESVDDASGVVTLSSGSSEAASSGDVSVQSGVAATVAGRVSVSGESSSSSTGGAVTVSGVGGDVTVSSGDSSSSTTGSSVFGRSGSGGTLSLVQGNSSAAGADVELVAGGVGSKDAAQKMRIVGSANSQGAGGFVSIYDGSSAASEGDTALLTAVVVTPSSVSSGSARSVSGSGDTSAGRSMCGVCGGRLKVASKTNVRSVINMTRVDEHFDMLCNSAVRYRVVLEK
ncbi:hypothetical protein PC120_g1132 [Phytophthora cactorum]|nr:hypothetical protein PC120_g1132 [Phytophthora cactorum]